jgi:hypothetical protein
VYDTLGPIELVRQPALSMRVRGVGRPLKPNRARKLTITLANPGDAAISPVRLRLGRARGLQAKPATTSARAIDPGAKRTVTVKVTLTGRARNTTKVKLTASAGELVAREKLRFQLRRPSKPGGGNGGRDRPTHLHHVDARSVRRHRRVADPRAVLIPTASGSAVADAGGSRRSSMIAATSLSSAIGIQTRASPTRRRRKQRPPRAAALPVPQAERARNEEHAEYAL